MTTGGGRDGTAPAGWPVPCWDVVVLGGGNAGLVSALAANDLGARVLIVERAPRHLRGGNTRHTRNVRCVHDDDDPARSYRFEELWKDLQGVGEVPGTGELAELTVRESATVPAWMSAHGIRWQGALRGTLHLDRTNRFFLGGGKALVNTYYRQIARRPGIGVVYDATATGFEFDGARCSAVLVHRDGSTHRVRCRAVICASGGFEANIGWLRRYWGDAADNYLIRGTPCNDGHVLERLYAAGAGRAGQEKGFHAVAVDARAPRFDGGIATRIDAIPFGVVLNRDGRRFSDEGEDIWPKRYATWGRRIAEQPDQIAYCFWDSAVDGLFLPPMYGVASASTPGELASGLGLDPDRVTHTIDGYNHAVVPGRTFDARGLDDCVTSGLVPPKSHWARRIDTPPYRAIAMRPGITFTYLGVAVDCDARVVRDDGSTFDNMFAAGEIMSGNVLSTGYLAGFGLTIGSVWGRRAGTGAARHGS